MQIRLKFWNLIFFCLISPASHAAAVYDAICPRLHGRYLCKADGILARVEIEQTLSESITTYQLENLKYRADEQNYQLPVINQQHSSLVLSGIYSTKCLANRVEMTTEKKLYNKKQNSTVTTTTRTTWRLNNKNELMITAHITVLDPLRTEPQEEKVELICESEDYGD